MAFREMKQPCASKFCSKVTSYEALIATTPELNFFRTIAGCFIEPLRVSLGMAAMIIEEGLQGVP
jgi:hypothetical protein